MRAVVEGELLDGIAFANSALGWYSNIQGEKDLMGFRNIVRDTRKEIKKSMSSMMKNKGNRDWADHQTKTLQAIEKGLERIKKMAIENAIDEGTLEYGTANTFYGEMPVGRETYGLDFLMSMLVPDHSGNPNQYYFSPKTSNFMHSVSAPNKSVINAVFQALDVYKVVPDFKAFVKDFASVHRGFYDALVAGRGFHEGMDRLAETSMEGALLKSTINKSLINPFMPRKDFKSIKETFDMMPIMMSDYAEMFRQTLEDGAIIDPQTAFNTRRQIIQPVQ